MISKRRLEAWRKEALSDLHPEMTLQDDKINVELLLMRVVALSERILLLTQELMDVHLMRRK